LGIFCNLPKSNTQTQNSIIIFENPCTSAINGIINNKECCLNMLHDNALDDGPYILSDNFPCIYEDKNDELADFDDALIHESPILFFHADCDDALLFTP
jgi:hypothetical protein